MAFVCFLFSHSTNCQLMSITPWFSYPPHAMAPLRLEEAWKADTGRPASQHGGSTPRLTIPITDLWGNLGWLETLS